MRPTGDDTGKTEAAALWTVDGSRGRQTEVKGTNRSCTYESELQEA